MTDPKPDDRELDEFLAGKSPLSRLYREGRGVSEQPPPELDEAVLQDARKALRPAVRRWTAPLALAATVVLGFGVIWNLWQSPAVRKAEAPPPPAAAPAEMPAPEPVAPGAAYDYALKRKAESSAGAAREQAERQAVQQEAETKALRAPPAASMPEAAPPVRSAEEWLSEIRRLRDEGRTTEASTGLQAFRAQFPDQTVPEDLKSLQPAVQ